MIDEKRKQLIETEYKEVCPEEIPMWKYVLYSYKINSNFERKIELRNIDTVDDLLRGISKDTENLMDQVKSNMNKIQETKEKTDNLKSEMINSVKEITDSLVK
jgi:peptidoglycan hydrolase CwlO-like protein